ncbi:DapH/DapD/GlmU-related protein [Microbacterium sp. NPDC091382]|uniref:DapH/DapD/GlmU-related protein n=1 Tax=Microbacterium sp. NPDC091382 TaxID=3364210 RepID=UPI0038264C7F
MPSTVMIGVGLELPHGAVGLVVHQDTVIGDRVKLYQGVTIGRADVHDTDSAGGGRVVIGDDVVIGANAVVLFRSGQTIELRDRTVIGAGSVLLSGTGEDEVWAGNPARLVGRRKPANSQ